MFENLLNLPYLFLFIPLIFSAINILQNYKATNTLITVLVISFILVLSFYLMPEVLPNKTLQSKIGNDVLFIMTEYKIDFLNLVFLVMIFFTKLIAFLFFDNDSVYTKKLNFFFGIYLVNYFSICGILLSNNIFNIFLYIEFYSFTLYNLMSDYKKLSYTMVAYKYYNNGVLGSLFLIFFVFLVYLTFGSADIDYITANTNIIKNDYLYNLSIFIFLAAVSFKFFSFNLYFSEVLKSSEITNLLFINILFSDIIIGVYVMRKFIYSLFDLNLLFNIFHINYFFYLVGSILIIYSSIRIYMRRNLLPTIYSLSLIMLGYVIILIGMNNDYSFISMTSFLINHVLVNFLFYLITALCVYLYGKSDTPILYSFVKYNYIIYAIVLSKLCLPIASGFNSSWNYILSVIEEKSYYLFLPFIIEKSFMIFLFVRHYLVFTKEVKEEYTYLDIHKQISLNTNYMLSIFVLFSLIVIVSLFENSISNALLKFIKG